MGYRTNPIGLRLLKKKNWHSNVYSKLDYKIQIIKHLQVYNYLESFFRKNFFRRRVIFFSHLQLKKQVNDYYLNIFLLDRRINLYIKKRRLKRFLYRRYFRKIFILRKKQQQLRRYNITKHKLYSIYSLLFKYLFPYIKNFHILQYNSFNLHGPIDIYATHDIFITTILYKIFKRFNLLSILINLQRFRFRRFFKRRYFKRFIKSLKKYCIILFKLIRLLNILYSKSIYRYENKFNTRLSIHTKKKILLTSFALLKKLKFKRKNKLYFKIYNKQLLFKKLTGKSVSFLKKQKLRHKYILKLYIKFKKLNILKKKANILQSLFYLKNISYRIRKSKRRSFLRKLKKIIKNNRIFNYKFFIKSKKTQIFKVKKSRPRKLIPNVILKCIQRNTINSRKKRQRRKHNKMLILQTTKRQSRKVVKNKNVIYKQRGLQHNKDIVISNNLRNNRISRVNLEIQTESKKQISLNKIKQRQFITNKVFKNTELSLDSITKRGIFKKIIRKIRIRRKWLLRRRIFYIRFKKKLFKKLLKNKIVTRPININNLNKIFPQLNRKIKYNSSALKKSRQLIKPSNKLIKKVVKITNNLHKRVDKIRKIQVRNKISLYNKLYRDINKSQKKKLYLKYLQIFLYNLGLSYRIMSWRKFRKYWKSMRWHMRKIFEMPSYKIRRIKKPGIALYIMYLRKLVIYKKLYNLFMNMIFKRYSAYKNIKKIKSLQYRKKLFKFYFCKRISLENNYYSYLNSFIKWYPILRLLLKKLNKKPKIYNITSNKKLKGFSTLKKIVKVTKNKYALIKNSKLNKNFVKTQRTGSFIIRRSFGSLSLHNIKSALLLELPNNGLYKVRLVKETNLYRNQYTFKNVVKNKLFLISNFILFFKARIILKKILKIFLRLRYKYLIRAFTKDLDQVLQGKIIIKIKRVKYGFYLPSLIAKFIVFRLALHYKLGEVVYPILKEMTVLHRKKQLKKHMNGIMLICSGRFTRRQRASKRKFIRGHVGLSTLRNSIYYSFNKVRLKYGMCGIKVWLNKYINSSKITST